MVLSGLESTSKQLRHDTILREVDQATVIGKIRGKCGLHVIKNYDATLPINKTWTSARLVSATRIFDVGMPESWAAQHECGITRARKFKRAGNVIKWKRGNLEVAFCEAW